MIDLVNHCASVDRAGDAVAIITELHEIPSANLEIERGGGADLLPGITNAFPKLNGLLWQTKMDGVIVPWIAVAAVKNATSLRRSLTRREELHPDRKLTSSPILEDGEQAAFHFCRRFYSPGDQRGAFRSNHNVPFTVDNFPFRTSKWKQSLNRQSLAEIVTEHRFVHMDSCYVSLSER